MKYSIIKAKVESVVSKRVGLGESAYWDYQKNLLYWVDIHGKKLFIFDPLSGVNREFKFDEEIGSVVAKKGGGIVLAIKDRFIEYNPITNKIKPLTILDSEGRNMRFNDGKCDPSGRFWVGTMDRDGKKSEGSLYFLDKDYSLRKKIKNVTVSNGIAWSLDKKIMYYIDSPTYLVVSFDYDEKSGDIKNKKMAIEVDPSLGMPDGMAIDDKGMLWIALFGGGKVAKYNPKNGKLLSILEIPGAKLVTSCSFGGNDFSDLYITTSSYKLSNIELEQQFNAGKLLKASVGAQGVPLWQFLQ